jgi:hypothetical protein
LFYEQKDQRGDFFTFKNNSESSQNLTEGGGQPALF